MIRKNKIEKRAVKKVAKSTFVLASLLLFSAIAFSQDFSADMAKVKEFNKNDKVKIEYTCEVKMTDGNHDTTMIYTGVSVRYKKKYFSKNEMTESISNGDTLVVVDHFTKQIFVYSAKVLDKILKPSSNTDISTLADKDSVALLSNENGIKSYMVYFSSGNIHKMNLIIDADGKVLESGLYYNELESSVAGMKSSVTKYKSYNTNITKADFNYELSLYLVTVNKQLQAVKGFEEYRIKNLLN